MSDDLEQHGSSTPATTEPIQDPGLQPHQWRPTDVDPAQERRAERQVSGMFFAAALLFVVFCFS